MYGRHTAGRERSSAAALPWLVFSALLGTILPGSSAPAANGDALWDLLRGGGQVVLMRHASTEGGIGDPAGFRLDDCRTQRNLSTAGREEARRLGHAFKSRNIPLGRVLSSRWCRCLDSARLAFGTVEPWEPLDSFFNDRVRA